VSHRILVVDDDPAILDIVCWTLEDEGYTTQRAQDGLEALAAIRRAPPDLVLLDLRMPRLNGWELYQILSTDSAAKELPVIIMTADQTTALGRTTPTTLQLLPKPFSLDELVHTVDAVLNTTRKSRTE
jgi:DNA-binding response OmpR family regulator